MIDDLEAKADEVIRQIQSKPTLRLTHAEGLPTVEALKEAQRTGAKLQCNTDYLPNDNVVILTNAHDGKRLAEIEITNRHEFGANVIGQYQVREVYENKT